VLREAHEARMGVRQRVVCGVWPTLRPLQVTPALLCKVQDAVLCGGRVGPGQMETGSLICGCMLLRDAYFRSPQLHG
jgi:hypothetical protein